MIEEVSCIRFKPQTEVNHKDFIEFHSGRGCYSPVGRLRHGKQKILLRSECAKEGTHLIAHQVINHEVVPEVNVFLLRSFMPWDFTTSISVLAVTNISKSTGIKFPKVLSLNF